MSELETDRLHLRPFGPHDLDLLAGLHGDAEVMATMRSGVQTRDRARAVNTPSRWVMEGAGMRLERTYPEGEIALKFCAISRDDWLAIKEL